MTKNLTLAEIKAIYGEACFETETAFGVNDFGKYRPGMTFILQKQFNIYPYGGPQVPEGGQMTLSNPNEFQFINPLKFVADREVTANMNVDWDGETSLLFGDFWRSKKGGACFRPKNPIGARHLLIQVKWGGAFNRTRGSSSRYAEAVGAIYFRRASSNGGGAGRDYWVLPMGFTHIVRDKEIDGCDAATDANYASHLEEHAKVYRQKHADLVRRELEEADAFQKNKEATEAESRQARPKYLPILEAIENRLMALRKLGTYRVFTLKVDHSYFRLEHQEYLYSDENIKEAEARVTDLENQIAEAEERHSTKDRFERKFAAYYDRVAALGFSLMRDGTWREVMLVKAPCAVTYNGVTRHEIRTIASFEFSEEALASFVSFLETKEAGISAAKAAAEAKAEQARAEASAKAADLPSGVRIWHRDGATNAGQGWVITTNGMDRDYDGMENPRPRYRQEGWGIWRQILPGEVVLSWAHACTAAEHEFKVIYRPEILTEAQMERILEIQEEIEDKFRGKTGLSGTPCPPVGKGWDLI